MKKYTIFLLLFAVSMLMPASRATAQAPLITQASGTLPANTTQSGILQGIIRDGKTRQPVSAVNIYVVGTSLANATDGRGIFEISGIPAGKYKIRIRHMSYQDLEIEEVVIVPGKITDLEISLESGGEELQEVVVAAQVNRESNITLLADRKKTSMVVQKVGAQELSRKGIGTVGEGLAKVVGVAMVGDKTLFVRGLGDRYNNATLNGLPVPSVNPDVKLIPMDIFPTSIVRNIEVLKSYDVAYYGDFSGGTIDVVTKTYPDRPFLKIGLSSGYNSNATGRQILGTDRGITGMLGFSRADRAIPDMVDGLPVYDSYHQDNADPGFRTSWVPYQYTAPLNTGLSLSGGDRIQLDGEAQFGYLFSLSNKNESVFQTGRSAWYNAQQEALYAFDTEEYAYNTNTSGLLSLYFKPHQGADYGLTGLFVNDSKDAVYDNAGENWDLGEIFGRRNTLVQNTLLTGQFSTSQQLSDNFSLKGSLAYTKTKGSIPDRTQLMAEARGNKQYQFSINGITDVNRYFSDLDDQDAALHLHGEAKVQENSWGLLNYVAGFDARYKKRRFDARQIDADARSIRNLFRLDELDGILAPGKLGIGDRTTWRYKEVPNEQNKYRSDMQIYAPYVNLNFRWTARWSMVAGLRFEQSRQSTDYKLDRDIIAAPYRNNTITGSDLLPAVSLKYMPEERSNIILAFSKTIARPLFTEAAPFRYNESAGTAQRQGNPFLKNGSVYNLDLRYDFFPNPGELFSASIFGKQLYDPIELVRLTGSEPMFSYVNSDRAIVAGLEIELNRNLGRLLHSDARALQQLSLGLNGSYLYSQIEFKEENLKNKGVPFYPTNFKRPLFGASPYLVNADLSYRANWSQRSHTQFTAMYSVFGKRMFIAGSEGTGDIYEMPVSTLNAAINTVINNRIGLDFTLSNILDARSVFNQEFAGSTLEYMAFKKGISAGLTLSYTF